MRTVSRRGMIIDGKRGGEVPRQEKRFKKQERNAGAGADAGACASACFTRKESLG